VAAARARAGVVAAKVAKMFEVLAGVTEKVKVMVKAMERAMETAMEKVRVRVAQRSKLAPRKYLQI